MQGKVKFFNETKGFGFIVPNDGNPDIFFHISNCVNYDLPQEEDLVSFEVGEGRDGRPTALNVTLVTAEDQTVEDETA